jgi:Type I phosphodiesterase / nucleotide pyrophosphatase
LSIRTPFDGLLWIVWDGASCDVVNELLDQGELPALRSLSAGSVVPLAPLSPNCQTPPSLASLYTGAAIAEHGVTGFRVPARELERTFVEWRSGFDAPIDRPLIWDQVVAAGDWAGLCHVAWGTGDAAGRHPASLAIDAYPRRLALPGVIEAPGSAEGPPTAHSFDLGGVELVVRTREGGYEVSAPVTGDRVVLTPSARLKLDPKPLRFGPGMATRLGMVAQPGARNVLVHTGLWEIRTHVGARRASPGAPRDELDASSGVFVGTLLGEAYRAGRLGPRLDGGGDGGAEHALMESARWQVEDFTGSCEIVLRRAPPDGFVIAYLPTIDEVQHELFRGWVSGPADQAQRGAREVIRRAYALADEQLARLLRHVGPGCAVVVCSDHGAAAVARDFYANQTLVRAGLARFDEQGRIDARASRVAYHPAGNGSVWVNDTGRPAGLVTAEERDAVVDAAERALSAARDPLTGRAPVAVARVSRAERHLFGDLYLWLKPGYDCLWEPGVRAAEFAIARESGSHLTPTGESTLRGVLATGGRRWTDRPEGEMTIMDVHDLVQRLIS